MEQTNILAELEEEIVQEPASKGQRFVNLLIDSVAMYLLAFLIAVFFVASTMNSGSAEYYETRNSSGDDLLYYFIGYICAITYYTLLEGLTKGRSLGKLATRTRAVKEDGTEITFKDAFIRSLCRCIPFEAFSIFGNGLWHDTISKTKVVKI